LGERRLGRVALYQQLGDPEIEQLDLPIGRDQDVGRLEVPVHHQIAVGILDGVAHREEETETAIERKPAAVAVSVDRLALHVLHGEPWQAFAGDAAVQQLRDVRMVQRGEDLALLEKSADQVGIVHAPAEELQGDALPVLVVRPLGHVDHAHAAAAGLTEDAVRTDAHALRRGLGLGLSQAHQRIDGAGPAARKHVLGSRERHHQPLHCRLQLRVRLAPRGQVCRARRRVEREHRVEQRLNGLPAFPGDGIRHASAPALGAGPAVMGIVRGSGEKMQGGQRGRNVGGITPARHDRGKERSSAIGCTMSRAFAKGVPPDVGGGNERPRGARSHPGTAWLTSCRYSCSRFRS
jgi:hypothetical protein